MITFYFMTPFLSLEEERTASNSRKTLFNGYERLDVQDLDIDASWQLWTTNEESVNEMMQRVSKKIKKPVKTAPVFAKRDTSEWPKDVQKSIDTYLWENPTKELQGLSSNYDCQTAMQKWLMAHQQGGTNLIGLTPEALTLLLNSYDVTYHHLNGLAFLSGTLIELKIADTVTIKSITND